MKKFDEDTIEIELLLKEMKKRIVVLVVLSVLLGITIGHVINLVLL